MRKLFFVLLFLTPSFLFASAVDAAAAAYDDGGGGGGAAPPADLADPDAGIVLIDGFEAEFIGENRVRLRNRFGDNRERVIPPGMVLMKLSEAKNKGWYLQWQFLHSSGWRDIAMEECRALNDAYSAGQDTLELKCAGKKGTPYVYYLAYQFDGLVEIHDGFQFSIETSKIKAIRWKWMSPEGIDEESKQGWVFRYPLVAVNVVHAQYKLVEEGEKTRDEAHALLNEYYEQEMQIKFKTSKKGEDPLRAAIEALKYAPMQQQIYHCLSNKSELPVVTWQWFHDRVGWREFRGIETALFEERLNAGEPGAWINGGKPLDGLPARPLRIMFQTPWSKTTSAFASHTQEDFSTKRRRGVRRMVKTVLHKDMIFSHWTRMFPNAPTGKAYKIYESFLGNIVRDDYICFENIQTHEATALAALQNLNDQSDSHLPPQEDAPEEFSCTISLDLMVDPVWALDRRLGHFERGAILECIQTSGTHPMTRAPLQESDLVSDDELRGEIHRWCLGFIRHGQAEGELAVEEELVPAAAVEEEHGGGGAAAEPTPVNRHGFGPEATQADVAAAIIAASKAGDNARAIELVPLWKSLSK